MANVTHHQRGAAPSTAPEMRSVIQLKLRRFRTSGTRSNGFATEVDASPSITSGAVVAPSIVNFRFSNFEFRMLKTSGHSCARQSTIENRKSKISSRFLLRVQRSFVVLIEIVLCLIGTFRTFMSQTRYRDPVSVGHFWVRVPDPREITRARIHVQIFEQPVIAFLRLDFRHAALGIFYVAEHDRVGRAGLGA